MERKHGSNWIDNAVYNEQLEAIKVDIVNCDGSITQDLMDQLTQLEEGIAQNLIDQLISLEGDLSNDFLGQFSVLEDQLNQIISLMTPTPIPEPIPIYPVPSPPYTPLIPINLNPIKTKTTTITTKKKLYVAPNSDMVEVDMRIIKFERTPVEKIFYNVASIEYDKLVPMINVPVDFEIRNKRLMDQLWSFSSTRNNPGYYFLNLAGTNKPYRFGTYTLIDAGRYIQFFPLDRKKYNILNIKK